MLRPNKFAPGVGSTNVGGEGRFSVIQLLTRNAMEATFGAVGRKSEIGPIANRTQGREQRRVS